MAGTLHLRLLSGNRPAEAAWCVRAPDAPLQVVKGTLSEAAAASVGHRVVVLVPAADVLLTQVTLPTRQRQRLLKAVPYALEEQLAEEVESLHFALGRRDAAGRIAVAVVTRSRMDAWLERLWGAGLQPSVLIPDSLGVPVEPGQWSLLVEEETAILRCTPDEAHLLPLPLPAPLLAERLAAGEAPAHVNVYTATGAEPPEELVRFCSEHHLELKSIACNNPLEMLTPGLEHGPALNLLQGEYARTEKKEQASWRPWLPAAALFAAVALLQTGMLAADHHRLSREAGQLAEAIDDTYRRAFPEATRVVAAQIQMERQLTLLRSGGAQDRFTTLLADTAPVLHRTPGLELRGMRYGEGTLEIDLRLADLRALDTLKQELASTGLTIEIQGANARNGGVESRLIIRRGSA